MSTFLGSSRALLLLLVVLGYLTADISACGSVSGPSLTGGASSSSTTGGGGRVTDADVTSAAVTTPSIPSDAMWPDGMAGIWTGKKLGIGNEGLHFMAGKFVCCCFVKVVVWAKHLVSRCACWIQDIIYEHYV
jgi:hypothetical protein